jgi:hypothetical protein
MTTHLTPTTARRMDRRRGGGSRTLSPARRHEASTNASSHSSHLAREIGLPRILHLAPAWRTALVVVLVAVALAVIVALFTATGVPTPSPSTVPHPQPAGF